MFLTIYRVKVELFYLMNFFSESTLLEIETFMEDAVVKIWRKFPLKIQKIWKFEIAVVKFQKIQKGNYIRAFILDCFLLGVTSNLI